MGSAGLLDGLQLGRCEAGPSGEICNWLLSGLGASLDASSPGARLLPSTVSIPSAGLPPGAIDYATGIALAIATLAGRSSPRTAAVPETAVAIQVLLPQVMAASYGSPIAMRPAPPLEAPGGGWLAADLGSPGDRQAFECLLETLPERANAPTVASAAQEWRLPVCDYRRRLAVHRPVHPIAVGELEPVAPGQPSGAGPLAGLQICDMTSMWAGPLATWILAGLGASVHKVEPDFRPDGFRALDGAGIHPGGHQSEPGHDSAMWNALNVGKVREPLDLRDPADRAEFVALAGACDVLIDSFSPRVMPNFGVTEEVAAGPGRPVMVSMPAFPAGPQRDWVAYGTGVHAALGLGDTGGYGFEAPAVSYPDPIAGFTAALAVVAGVVGRDLGVGTRRMEVSLAAASQPLQWIRGGDSEVRADPGALLAAGLREGLLVTRSVAGIDLLHPAPLFVSR